ncbi:Rha family transcriptional regulator [Pseudomonas fluorescens]|jgi:phage regulator Rha-like protein|uniref:Rha family transcriptional regulator n=1 Tax=Pseudomonas fluorescens TaxID=294 RepID=UPI0020C4072B|nr:Rha family transcriptional regulator [Pseudomonas fluorescens]UTL92442.1 Rha family transcriptional regulator [Pseudomonas fluorescens]
MNLVTTTELTMSSREIAELTGKRHDNVTADIRSMLVDLKKDVLTFQGIYFDSMNRQQTEYLLDREHTDCLLTGYSTPMRMAVIKRWHQLEAQQGRASFDTDEGKLLMIQELASKQLALIAENRQIAEQRDEAVRTKAHIGAKREATAMAVASAAVRKVKHLENELGRGCQHATVTAVEKAAHRSFGGQGFRPLKNWCDSHGVAAPKVQDPRFGWVRSWPAAAWAAVYQIELADLFGAAGEHQ